MQAGGQLWGQGSSSPTGPFTSRAPPAWSCAHLVQGGVTMTGCWQSSLQRAQLHSLGTAKRSGLRPEELKAGWPCVQH